MLELWLRDVIPDLGEVLAESAQGLVQKYKDNLVVKLRDEPQQVQRELKMMAAAGDLSVTVVGYVYTGPPKNLEGFVMPLLCPIDALSMTIQEKLDIYRQMRSAIETLHLRGIIHGDVNLSNMLLDERKCLKLCDFGISSFASEIYFPSAFTVRYCSQYRLREGTPPKLVEEEDIYALGITLWEFMTGRKAFEDIDNEEELEEAIRKGRKVDVTLVENYEVRTYISLCLNVFQEFEG